METSVNDRYLEIITRQFGGNKSLFAKAIGVTPSVIDNIVGKRAGKPSYDVIAKTCRLEGLSASWLILGQGEMMSVEQATPKDPLEGILVEQQLRSVMKQNEMLLKNVEQLTRLLEQEKKKHESTPSREQPNT